MAWISFCSRETIGDSNQTSDTLTQPKLCLHNHNMQNLVANYAHSLQQVKTPLVLAAAAILEI